MTAVDRHLRCSAAAADRGDAAFATAAPARRWLLVEVPGSWGPDAVLESELDPRVARRLAARAAAAGARLTLIRRTGRTLPGTTRSWAVADTDPGREAVTWGSYERDEDLLDVPLDAHRDPADAPVYLVCTHGRHDACCAIWGRPVASALAALRPAETWECSHIGGDRFAPNLVALPHGLYYGRVTPLSVVDVVAAYEQGRVVPELLRGRSALTDPVQAAQHYARLELAEDGVDALAPLGVRFLGDGTWDVTLADRPAPLTVRVRARFSAEQHLLTCRAARPARARTYDLLAVERATAPA
jgi:hypothetical protein